VDLKVVIVDYLKSHQTNSLLNQLARQTQPINSLVVIDNSPDNIESNHKYTVPCSLKNKTTLIKNSGNLGYSKSCNIGAKGNWDYILFLNPDIEIPDERLINKLILTAESLEQDGSLDVTQKNPDGSYEVIARSFPTIGSVLAKRTNIFSKIFKRKLASYMSRYPNQKTNDELVISAEWLQSSLLLVPRKSWNTLQGFDERFFVFMADVDFGRRSLNAGLKNYLISSLSVNADGVRSSEGGISKILFKKTIRIHILDYIRYTIKWNKPI
jgi:N-acetylglucosaminyl-diphospho-decaprenol L-rhamnosyltransferase